MNGNGDEMTDELKPCPFCGSDAEQSFVGGNDIQCSNSDCQMSLAMIYPYVWNTRPIEDALRAHLAARDALIERLVGAGIEINSCTKVSTFSAEYYTLCKAQREWNEAVTDWETLKGEALQDRDSDDIDDYALGSILDTNGTD